jgi:UPF0176 protein
MNTNYSYINISAYKFITFVDIKKEHHKLAEICNRLQLKGTILLASEGINISLSGTRGKIGKFVIWLRDDKRFSDLQIKESYSAAQPFKKMLVKKKAEIIKMGRALVEPGLKRAPVLRASTLKTWLDQGYDDDGRRVVMLDARNKFEVEVGTFNKAISCQIDRFSDFPATVAAHKRELSNKTVVTFCTGGIRCEKATIYMQNIGFSNVYQLEGGVLKYFEEYGNAHYGGDCFVFDQRIALDSRLRVTKAVSSSPLSQ